MTRQVNVGIIGAGRIGRVHAENLAYRIPEANVVAIADIFVEAAEQCAADLGIPSAIKDHRAIINNDQIEAVVICSSTDTHAQFIEEAAAAGKHIFCEKPIDLDLKRIDRALEAVEKAGVKLQIGFNRRFDPSFRRVRDMVSEGKIGAPHIVHIISRDPAPPPIEYIKVSGGIFVDMTIHDFDMARYLIGSEVEEVYAIGGVMVDPKIGQAGDVDTALVTLRYANGAIGYHVGQHGKAGAFSVDVLGSEGTLRAGMYMDTVLHDKDGKLVNNRTLGLPKNASVFKVAYEQIAAYLDGGPMPHCARDDYMAVNEIGFGMIESAMTGRTVSIECQNRDRLIFANG